MLRNPLRFAAIAAPFLLFPASVSAQWLDSLDAYANGSLLEGQGGWEGWWGTPTGTLCVEFPAASGDIVASVGGANDTVHSLDGPYTTGQWWLRCEQFIPPGFSGHTYFIALNQYDGTPAVNNWSMQMTFDSLTGVADLEGGAPAATNGPQPLVTGAWAQIALYVDLDTDFAEIYYNGMSMYTFQWSQGVSGGGLARLGTIDLFANGATQVLYNNFRLEGAADECTSATVIGPGATQVPFNNTTATTTAGTSSSCGMSNDIWFAWTPSPGAIVANFDTCTGSTFDTEIAVFDGDCATLNQLACNDDFCGLQSGINQLPVTPGTTYYVEVGYWSTSGAGSGTGLLTIVEPPPPVVTADIGRSPNRTRCLGFDDPFVPSGPIAGNDPAFTSAGIASVTLVGSWSAAGDLVSAPSNADGQCLVSQGGALAIAGVGQPLDNPAAGGGFDLELAAPATELSLMFVDQINWTYQIELFLGGSSLGTAQHSYSGSFNLATGERVWTSTVGPFDRLIVTTVPANGGWGIDRICFNEPSFGTGYCQAVANSTGEISTLSATGSDVATDNDFTVVARPVPVGEFGYFVASMNQGFIANPGGSAGNFCLGAGKARFVNQIAAANAFGMISASLDLTNFPVNPAVAVMGGETWNFQLWHRDGPTSNFSEALEVPFL